MNSSEPAPRSNTCTDAGCSSATRCSPGTNTSGSRRGSPWATPTPSTRDTCDILIHLPDGRQLAVDAKAYGRAERLAREIEDDTGIAQMCADEVAYVVPDQVERDHPGYRALCNAVLRGKTGYSCETLRNFSKRLNAAAKGGTR